MVAGGFTMELPACECEPEIALRSLLKYSALRPSGSTLGSNCPLCIHPAHLQHTVHLVGKVIWNAKQITSWPILDLLPQLWFLSMTVLSSIAWRQRPGFLRAQSDPGHLCFPSTTPSPLTALHGLFSPSGMSFHVILGIFSSLLKCFSDSSPQQRWMSSPLSSPSHPSDPCVGISSTAIDYYQFFVFFTYFISYRSVGTSKVKCLLFSFSFLITSMVSGAQKTFC